MGKGDILHKRLISFVTTVSSYCNNIQTDSLGRVLSLQIVRAATSVSLNHAEAKVASSTRDFIHKLRIALKEQHEVKTGLEILAFNRKYPDQATLDYLLNECSELSAMLYASIRTAEKRLKEP